MKLTILQKFNSPTNKQHRALFSISWYLTALVVSGLLLIAWLKLIGVFTFPKMPIQNTELPEVTRTPQKILPPEFSKSITSYGIQKITILRTNLKNGIDHKVVSYKVEKGDSIFKISKKFSVKPETILWANPETFNDNPELLTIGMNLNIPATDGIYYQWKAGDVVVDVASRFNVDPSAILLWPENELDVSNPIINPGSNIMIPGGKREMVSWVMPTIPRGKSGVSKSLVGPGACDTTDGAYGTGTFVWPAVNNYLSGNDFWSGHLALDIASNLGSPVFASDSGLVVYAGWNNTGYGNMVLIDHGNGYQTLYAHLSQVSVSCGGSIYQGSPIGSSGNTGKSTGPHLHFETRYLGGLVNPWSLMP